VRVVKEEGGDERRSEGEGGGVRKGGVGVKEIEKMGENINWVGG